MIPRCKVDSWTMLVSYYYRPMIPGWKVSRIRGSFHQLPPLLNDYFGKDRLDLFLSKGSPTQKKLFNNRTAFTFIRKTKLAKEVGLYWDGKRAYKVTPDEYESCHLGTIETRFGKFIGMIISGTFNKQPYSYLLASDQCLDYATFYKYLLFYRGKISRHFFIGGEAIKHLVPFSDDVRLSECSINSLKS